ncbi:amino acid adenylation domain-containing protein [Kitasatospora sp. NPDC054795]
MTGPTAAGLALSAGQADIWFDEKLSGGGSAYNTAGYLDIRGPLDVALFRRAARQLVEEAECTRIRVRETAGEPRQIVEPLAELPFRVLEPAGEQAALAWMRADLNTAFDPERGPLFRLALLRLDTGRALFYMCIHHLLCDGYSQVLFWRRLSEIYQALLAGQDPSAGALPPLGVLLDGERAYQESAQVARDVEYWQRRFPDTPEPVTLAERDAESGPGFVRSRFELAGPSAERLREVARQSAVTWPTVVMAAVGAYTWRLTGARDVLLTVPVTARVGARMRAVPGMVANTLPLALRFDPGTVRGELLRQASREFTRGLKHQRLRVSRIRRAMGLRSDDKRPFGPLVNILPQQTRLPLGPCEMTVNNLSTGLIDDFEITVVEAAGQGLTVHLSGNDRRYDQAEMDAHAARLRRLVERFVDLGPATPLGQLDLLADEDRAALLRAGAGARVETSTEGLVERVRQVAGRRPDAIAVADPSGALTYGRLVAAADAVSRQLPRPGLVAVLASPGREFVTAVLGVIGAGGAYIPLDVRAPRARLAALIADSGAAWVLADAEHHALAVELAALAGGAAEPLLLDGEPDPARELSEPVGSGDHLAYVIYTSGSTGAPKGAMVHRAGMVNHLLGKVEDLGLTEADTVVQNAPVTFDISVWQMLAPFLVGGRVRIVDRDTAADPDLLFPLTTAESISVLEVVPSLLRAALDAWQSTGQLPELPGLRLLMVTGEALPADLAARWTAAFPTIPLVNAYGPTECSDDVTHAVITPDTELTGAGAPIGRPLRNTLLYLLDDELHPVQDGVAGDLYAAGAGVGRGYLGDSGRTAAAFLADPFGPPGTRMYRTGDRAVRRPDGQLEFLERRDHQVKIRGHRIELGEIEAALRRLPGLAQAAVLAVPDTQGRRQLVGYLVADGPVAPEPSDVRRRLADVLPDYMVPAHVRVLPELPLTAHGKVDRMALPVPDLAAPAGNRPTRTRNEEILCGVLAEVLGLAEVGVDDSFFELGGDSISSIQVVSRARRAGLAVTARDVFDYRTPRAMAAVAEPVGSDPADARGIDEGPGELELLPVAHQLRESLESLDRPAREYSQHVVLDLPAGIGEPELITALNALLDRHEALRQKLSVPVEGLWTLEVLQPGAVPAERLLTTASATAAPLADQLAEHTAEARALLAPEDGMLLRAVLLAGAAGQPDRLILVGHHLAVDGVSWRILLPDLREAWEDAAAGRAPALDRVPTSLRHWGRALSEEARSAYRVRELPFWRRQLEGVDAPLGMRPLDPSRDVWATAGHLRAELTTELTQHLLTTVPAAFHAETNDLLLTALALAAADWRRRRGVPQSDLLVEIEGHGREQLGTELDLSRTVGWLTSVYPARLDAGETDWADLWAGGRSAGAALKRIKQQLRELPGRGLGFGLLRHLNPQTQAVLSRLATPQLGFNYLGRFTGTAGLSAAGEAVVGLGAAPQTPLRHVVELSAVAEERADGPVLVVQWDWAGELLVTDEVEDLAATWQRVLEALVAHAAAAGAGGRTPSDFPLVTLTQAEVESFERSAGPLADVLPLTALQQGLFFQAEFDREGVDPYTLQIAVDVAGELDPALLRASAEALLRRHDNLRAAFLTRADGEPVQVVPQSVRLGWSEQDLTDLAGPAQQRRLAELTDEELSRRFDLASPPLVRFTVLRLGAERHRLLWSVHHALVDGWSMAIFAQELFTLYANGADLSVLAPVTPYRDYAAWLETTDEEADRAAWKGVLDGVDEGTLLVPGAGAAEPALPQELFAEVDEELTARLTAWAGRHGLTLNTVVQGAWAVLLGELTGRRDVLFGCVGSGRPAELAGVESIVGSFLNTLPVRVRLDRGGSAAALLSELQEQQFTLADHQRTGLAELQQLVGVGELFDTVVSFNNYPMADVSSLDGLVPGLSFLAGEARVVASYPFALSVYPGSTLRLHVQYSPSAFEREAARDITERFVRLLSDLVSRPGVRTAELSALTEDERKTILRSWGGTVTADPRTVVTERFEVQAARRPQAPAVLFRGTELGYGELNARANRLARLLIDRGIGPEQTVALALPRGPEAVVATLAVLKAGAGFLPIDADYPADRIAYMLTDAAPAVLLTDAASAAVLPVQGVPVLLSDAPRTAAELALLSGADVTDRERTAPLLPSHLAYTIYTSGSTGRPKGVMVDHRGFAAMVASLVRRFGLGEGDRVLQFASLSFDASVWELGLALLNGGVLVVADEESRTSGQPLAELLTAAGVTMAGLPPVVAAALPAEAELPAGLTIAVAGEACPPEVVARLADRVRLFNGYGPTEAVVAATVAGPLRADAGRPPIGSPTAAHRVYVLDGALRPVGVGVAGELYLGGGLARGYLNQPALTAQRFVADPHGPAGERMYRTGDLARWLPDGQLDFLGRSDDQVQLRGFRIELGEIESVLAGHPSVSGALVTLRQESSGGGRLVAYVVGDHAGRGLEGELRRRVAETMPEHMVPAAVVLLERWPLTPQGKVDRNALPAPDFAGRAGGRAPRTLTEEILCGIFADVLELPRVGIDDDFFALGGHSLLATRVIGRARRLLGVELPIRALFEARTVAVLAARVAGADEARPEVRARAGAAVGGIVPLSYAQRRLWFVHRMEEGGRSTYNVPLALRIRGGLDLDALQSALRDLVTRHEVLRSVFPHQDDVPYQQVLDAPAGDPVLAVSQIPEAELAAALTAEARAGFDLLVEPALRTRIFSLGGDEYVLLLVFHHIAFDGWSIAPLVRDLGVAYEARAAGRQPGWSPLPVQYSDFSLWQREVLGGEDDPDSVLSRQLDYWRAELAGLPEELELPADFPRPAVSSHDGGGVDFDVDPALYASLGEIARESGATVFMVLQAAFAALLTRLGAGTDIPLGSPIAGRTDDALTDLVGTFINTLVLRTDTSGDPAFRTLVDRVRETDLAGYAHQDLPFEQIVEAVNPTRSLGRHPLFQVMLVLQNNAEAPAALPGLRVGAEPVETGTTKFDLRLQFDEVHVDGRPTALRGLLEYATDLYTETTVRALTERLLGVLRTVAADPQVRLSRIPVMDEPERRRILDEWSGVGVPLDLPDLAGLQPAAIAALRVLLLDAELEPVPAGVTGELCLLGEPAELEHLRSVARGADLLVAGPYGGPGARLLRTGVAMRWDHRGRLVPAPSGPSAPLGPDAIEAATGPDRPARTAPAVSIGPLAPRTRTEEVLSGIVTKVLGLDALGVDQVFFEHGMDSIRSMQVVSQARKAGLQLSIADVFAHQTTELLAAAVDRRAEPVRQAPPRGSVIGQVFHELDAKEDTDPFATVLALRPGGDRPPLFCLHSGVGFALPYLGLARHIGAEYPIYGVQAPSITELAPLADDLRSMAAEYVKIIRRVRPEGPYHLLGWSFGGSLAYEIAVQLQEAGAEVGLLANLDSYPRTAAQEEGDDQSLLGWVVELVGQDKAAFAGRELTPDDVVAVLQQGDSPMARLGTERVFAMLRSMRNNGALLNGFEPRPFKGRMQLFVASANLSPEQVEQQAARWRPHVDGGVDVHQVPCSHDYMMHPDPLALIGGAVAAELQRAHLTAALRAGGAS